MNTEDTLVYIIDLFSYYLETLSLLERNDFIHGEMTAYVETLEIIQYYCPFLVPNTKQNLTDKYKI